MNRCFSLLSILLIVSCSGNRQFRAILNQAGSCMSASPDSSLALVNGIDGESLPTRRLRARHALLKTMAQDKCYIDVAEDSTIQVAYDYYRNHGEKRDRLLATYYLGVIRQNANDYIPAALAFREAEPMAQELEDYRQLSLIQQHLSHIFESNYNRVRALDYAEKALDSAEKAGERLMADYCRYDIAFELLSEFRYEEAEPYLAQILSSNDENSALYSMASKKMAQVYIFGKNSDYAKAKQCLKEAEKRKPSSFNCSDYGLLALISEAENDPVQADSYLRIAESMLRSSADSAIFYNDSRNVYDLRGDWKRAHGANTESSKILYRIFIETLRQSVTHAIENHYESEWKIERERSSSRLYLLILIGTLLLAVCISVVALLRKRNQRIIDDMARIQDVSSDMVDTLIADKIKSLQRLSESYFSWEENAIVKREHKEGKQSKDEIISSFRTQLSELRNDYSFVTALEQSLNLSDNGIMARARQLLSSEKELDFSILTLLFSGFSIKSISYLLRMSEASLRMRKTRFKQQFELMTEPERSLFMEKLG